MKWIPRVHLRLGVQKPGKDANTPQRLKRDERGTWVGLRPPPPPPCRLFSMLCRMLVSRAARGVGGEPVVFERVLSLSAGAGAAAVAAAVACSHICCAATWVARVSSVSGGGAMVPGGGGEDEDAGDRYLHR